ncbi:MAG: patatin-like phospholipase family protein [Nitrospira sp.]|nr:patatin-like phospholipase family protein [Nitrospira sp.]
MLATASCGWVKPRANFYTDTKEYSETDFRKAEAKYYKNSSTTPKFCVALSGGGIRSAAYSIGVLKGLHISKRQLPDVDIISAVSGGSYAATWLYDQYAQQVTSEASGLDKWGRVDRVLSRKSIEEEAEKVTLFNLFQGFQTGNNFLGSTDVEALRKLGTGEFIEGAFVYGAGLIGSIFPPWNDKHETQSGSDYENNISNAFQNSLKKENTLALKSASPDLPYLIINSTIQGVQVLDLPVNIDNPNSRQLANNIFEFTSHGIGSPSVGYKSWAELKPEDRANIYSFSKVSSISGAAVHKASFPLWYLKFLQVFGRDIGLSYAMLTPTYTKYTNEWIKRFVQLTDGGDSENLGAYSLINRNCQEILVVDAEYDGEIDGKNWIVYDNAIEGYKDGYQFKGYQCLKQKLRKEGATLTIHELDQATNDWDCGVKNDAKNQDPKPKPTSPDKPISHDKLHCWNKLVNTTRYWFDCSKPVSTGTVSSTGKVSGQKDLQVTYVKLSADRKLLDDFFGDGERKTAAEKDYGPLITHFYKGQKHGDMLDKDFPHYSTFKLTWSKEEFLAVTELGCRAVVRHYAPSLLSSGRDACIDINRVTMMGTPEDK